jgi:hypothetical protein
MLLSRQKRVAASTAVAIAALIALDAIQGGVELGGVLTWSLGGAIMLPLAAVLAIVREKSDGTLRHLALLPIDGAEHAMARGLASLALATPAGVIAGALVPLLMPGGPGWVVLAAGAAVALGLGAMSLLLTAFQYNTPIGRGASTAMYGVVALLVIVRVGQAVWDAPASIALRRSLSTRSGLATSSLLLGLVVAIVWWVGARLIAHRAPRYRGDVAAE